MASEINYKNKYEALKLKFMNSVDMAFRLGYEQGMQDSASDNAQQQAQDAQNQAQQTHQMAMQHMSNNGQAKEEGEANEEEATPEPFSEHPDGSELDQHIEKLESLIAKPDANKEEIQKSLDKLISLRKSQLQLIKLNKSDKLSRTATKNIDDNAKKSLTLQEKIVKDVMKSFEEEEKRASRDILNILDKE